MARISVYVPDGMKERMDVLGDRVNWSEAAQAAFEKELIRRTPLEDTDMQQVVERLRASREKFYERQTQEGREHGRNWASLHAEYEDLRTIANLELQDPHNYGSYAMQFDEALTDDPGWRRGDWAESFWNDGVRKSAPADEYVEAFVEGASEIWSEVASSL